MYKKYIKVPVDDLYRHAPVFAKQYDYNSRYFYVTLTERGQNLIPSALGTISMVAIGIARGDGQRKAYRGEYNSETNTFILPLPGWAVENAGKLKCDVMVWHRSSNGKDGLLRSAFFEVYVQTSNYNGEDLSQDESVEILEEIMANLAMPIKNAEEIEKLKASTYELEVLSTDNIWENTGEKYQIRILPTAHNFKKIYSITAERKMPTGFYENMVYSYKRYSSHSISVIVDSKIDMRIIIKGEK